SLFIHKDRSNNKTTTTTLKRLINSENPRGRRPVTGHNSRKDPTTPDYQSDGGTMTEAELLGLIRRVAG
ncbi:hypothetical protein MMS66_30165, partial [Escherichia coli]|nr:hypothetical protein [Escherichia coli]MCM4288618.1 hypothetical protein [Escherichia coli]MCM4321276.1 hypothetical protein [Escherichia coli]MCM4333651.1 hypothetical protein [Escherichia coli]MCM4339309.1 hypothetical protein [Escherichia coli]